MVFTKNLFAENVGVSRHNFSQAPGGGNRAGTRVFSGEILYFFFCRGSGRKTASHFSWNRFRARHE
jgi:hypothetical protein